MKCLTNILQILPFPEVVAKVNLQAMKETKGDLVSKGEGD